MPPAIDWRQDDITQMFIEVAREKGLEDLARLFEKARADAERLAVRDLLEHRLTHFGPVPKWAKRRLDVASLAQLERWFGKTLTARRVEDVVPRR